MNSLATKDSRQRRLVLVHRKTRLQELVERFNTWPQARFYLEHNNMCVVDYLAEHDNQQRVLCDVEAILRKQGRLQNLERGFLPNYQFRRDDVVVVVGQDGLVANTLKYLDGQPVIGVNPDCARWEGVLLPFTVNELEAALSATLAGHVDTARISFAEATTNDGQKLLAVNDLFVGPKSHTSARYVLHHRGQSETHSSSGVIISTGFGSTGWLQSLIAGARAIAGVAGDAENPQFDWNAEHLVFGVREPFPSLTTSTELVFGEVNTEAPLALESLMPEGGVIFSDGMEDDFLNFNAGTLVTITLAKQQGCLVTAVAEPKANSVYEVLATAETDQKLE